MLLRWPSSRVKQGTQRSLCENIVINTRIGEWPLKRHRPRHLCWTDHTNKSGWSQQERELMLARLIKPTTIAVSQAMNLRVQGLIDRYNIILRVDEDNIFPPQLVKSFASDVQKGKKWSRLQQLCISAFYFKKENIMRTSRACVF